MLFGSASFTASHVRAGDIWDRECCLGEVVAHPYSNLITLINAVDEEIGESRVGSSKLGSVCYQQNDTCVECVHVVVVDVTFKNRENRMI